MMRAIWIAATLVSAVAFAQTDQAPSDPGTRDAARDARRQECRRQARQAGDPDERRHIIRQCRQELFGDGEGTGRAAHAAPVAPPHGGTDMTAGRIAIPAPVASPTGSAATAYVPAMPEPGPGVADTDDAGGMQDPGGSYAGAQQYDNSADENPGANYVPGYGYGPGYGPGYSPGVLAPAGGGGRGQRLDRLEQRLDEIEALLRQILANQQRLLGPGAAPTP